jgi:hypothetical protein
MVRKEREMKFRKKPAVFDAIQWTTGNFIEIMEFMHPQRPIFMGSLFANADDGIGIDTPEGRMIAEKMDWIIRGVKGEYYLRKPDIFEQTYELVKEGE